MRTLTLLLVLSLCTCVRAQTAFTNLSEGAARDLAAQAGTFVVIDFYANWCGPCKVMDEKVWTQDTVQTLQGNFVNIRIDGSTSNAGMMRYGIKAIPALIIMDANGKEFYRKGVAYRKTGKPELAQDCYDQLLEAPDNEDFLAMYQKEEQ